MKKIESIDLWYKIMFSGTSFDQKMISKMYTSLKTEYPMICTAMLEQACNLDCQHCFFKPEKSSMKVSQNCNLEAKLKTIVSQLPRNASVVDGGRILRGWHIPLLEKLRSIRSDISIGMVDNGTYLRLSEELLASPFRFDWIDISIDGTEETHNRQRRSDTAYATAIAGLERAKEFTVSPDEGGKVTSLFSASKLNYTSLTEAAQFLFEKQLVDEFHITPVSPVMRNLDTIMGIEEFRVYWQQVKEVFALGEKYGIAVFTRMYQAADMQLLAQTIGAAKLKQSFMAVDTIAVGTGCIRIIVEDVPVIYVPLSICPSETFLINPDGYYRLAYSIQFSLAELHFGQSEYGENTIPYTVGEIKEGSSFKSLYQQGVLQWKDHFGFEYLKQEFGLFQSLKE